MRILFLGGARFVGRQMVVEALHRGHDVTLFNRGKTDPAAFNDQVQTIRGDRNEDIGALSGLRFDAVIDVCAYFPGQVSKAIAALKGSVDRYVLVSTISVYDAPPVGAAEDGPTFAPLYNDDVAVDGDTYGPLKVACEARLRADWDPLGATIVRPGLIVGPGDYTDRFTYWLMRAYEGGPALAPDLPTAPIQYIDARDLANFTLDCVETGLNGTYNCVGPESPIGFGDYLSACLRVANPTASFLWATPTFLEAHEVAPWSDLPFVSDFSAEGSSLMTLSNAAARAHGLRFRKLDDILRDTLEWRLQDWPTTPLRAGWSREKELLAIDALSASASST